MNDMIDIRIDKAQTTVRFGEMRVRVAPGRNLREDGTSRGILALQDFETTEECIAAIAAKETPDADVLLVFDTVDSLDKVIRGLIEVRLFMTHTEEARQDV